MKALSILLILFTLPAKAEDDYGIDYACKGSYTFKGETQPISWTINIDNNAFYFCKEGENDYCTYGEYTVVNSLSATSILDTQEVDYASIFFGPFMTDEEYSQIEISSLFVSFNNLTRSLLITGNTTIKFERDGKEYFKNLKLNSYSKCKQVED